MVVANQNDVLFVCEFTTNHMGNLNLLLEMVKSASQVGADYIKMQKKDVDSFYSKEKLETPYNSPYGKTYQEYRNIFEFSKRDFDLFDEECKKYGMKWFATAQDLPSLNFLLQYDLDMYKVASCNSNKLELLKEFALLIPKGKTVVVSCAGRTLEEVKTIVDTFPEHKMILNHCVAEYPCPKESLKLGNISVLKEMFESEKVKIGYSGHEEDLLSSYGAVSEGAKCLERHFCLSRHSFVHHIECSLEPDEYQEMTQTIKSNNIPKNIKELLGEEAFLTDFGMSKKERAFLIENTYGSDYIGSNTKL